MRLLANAAKVGLVPRALEISMTVPQSIRAALTATHWHFAWIYRRLCRDISAPARRVSERTIKANAFLLAGFHHKDRNDCAHLKRFKHFCVWFLFFFYQVFLFDLLRLLVRCFASFI